MSVLESINNLRRQMSDSIIGQQDVINNLLIGLLANGNILLEGLPGLARTRAVVPVDPVRGFAGSRRRPAMNSPNSPMPLRGVLPITCSAAP
jgi:hypothetical protein